MSDSSEKTLWVFNHYAEEPSTGTGLRHYRLARQLGSSRMEDRHFRSEHGAPVGHQPGGGRCPLCGEGRRRRHVRPCACAPLQGERKAAHPEHSRLRQGMPQGGAAVLPPRRHLASSVHPLSWGLGRRFSRRFRVPWVCEVRDLWPESLVAYGLIGRGSLAERCPSLLRASGIQGLRRSGVRHGRRRRLRERTGWEKDVSASKTCWISNGIDLACFRDRAHVVSL